MTPTKAMMKSPSLTDVRTMSDNLPNVRIECRMSPAARDGRRRPSKEMLMGKRREAVIPGRIDEVHELHVITVFGGLLSLNTGWINAVAYRGFDGGITHVEGPAGRFRQSLGCPPRIQPVLRLGRHRLSHGKHPVQGICRG